MDWIVILLFSQMSFAGSIEIEHDHDYNPWKPLAPISLTDVKSSHPQIISKFRTLPLKRSPQVTKHELVELTPPPTIRIVLDKIAPQPIQAAISPVNAVTELPIHDLSPVEYKFLQAELFFESKQFELALGLYLDLKDEVRGEQKDNVIFRLAETALALDLYNDFKNWSLELLDKPIYREKVFQNLTLKIRSYDELLTHSLMQAESKYKLKAPDVALQYRLLKAHALTKKGNLNEALSTLDVPVSSHDSIVHKIQILRSIIMYRLGNLDRSISYLRTFIDSSSERLSADLKNESYLLLARLYFQKGNYHEAKNFYARIDQNYIEWLPAMTEMGWAQILQGDYEGASGNMFSLHTDFFRNHFIPDSYLARTVGYLGLCQYGDALKTVIDLKNRYSPLVEKTSQIKDTWTPQEFYDLIHQALKDPTRLEINGVPRSWISYLTRDVNFIQEQKVINALEDEINSYNKFTLKIINLEKASITEKQNLLKEKNLSPAQKEELYWANIKLHIYKKSREQMRSLRAEGLTRINVQKDLHKKLAGLALKQKMIDTHRSLLTAFEQVDLLQYEIFVGAGDQLRAVLSGLPIDPKSFKLVKSPKDPVEIKWEFKGEVWKDEIGYFRSSLKNICGESEPIRAASQQGESQ